MSYTPNTWQTGDTITAEKLNNIEQGIAEGGGGGALIVGMDALTGALDKTWQEIHDAMKNGMATLVSEQTAEGVGELYSIPFIGAGYSDDTYTVSASAVLGEVMLFVATSADAYPVLQS